MSKGKKKKEPRTPKEEKRFQNLLGTIQQFVQGKNYVPMTLKELESRLQFGPQHREQLQEILQQLQMQGHLQIEKGRYQAKKEHLESIIGTLRLHPRGFGFVQVKNSKVFEKDIFIPKHLTENAVDGDTVEVEVDHRLTTEKGPEGKITAILTRARTHVAGIIRSKELRDTIVAYVPLLGANQRVIVEPSREFDLQVGARFVMEVVDWGAKETETICRPTQYLGHISDPSCDITAAIEEFQIRKEFSQPVVDEAHTFGTRVTANDIAGREDFRQIECFTIDPDTAKDFDDALTLSKDEQGHYHLGVHIADVSHYVTPGSALDVEASVRCNSTYFPGTCVPMLPSELSDNLCSLKPEVNRLTASVLMHFDERGDLVDYRIARSVIKSAKRFTYKEAKEVLDGKKKSPHLPTLQLMVELCGLLKRKRYERGSIEFALPELVVIVDEKGVPYKTDYIEYDITHQLVEEFMLKANEIVATHLSNKGKNLTFRVHDEPSEEHMKDFSLLAQAFGFRLSETPTPEELRELFDEAVNTPYGPYLATSYIRRMRLATYTPDNIGHYGLGLSHYCHFTSPIRRYVDLVAHRILFGAPDEREELERISDLCSEQERLSAKAESRVVLLKKLRLLKIMHEKEPQKQFEAIITRVKNFGVFFEILDLMLEGFLHISELGDDFYIFEEAKMRLKGSYHGGGFSSGERITVMLKEVDLIMMETSWDIVPETHFAKEEAEKQPQKKPQRPQARKPFASRRKPVPKKSRHYRPKKKR